LEPAYPTRNHGYIVYDTLFALDDKFVIKPQMVERYEVSSDRLVYDFTLREGMLFHDGRPVTSEDVIASLKRWGSRDVLGRRLMAATQDIVGIDDRRFRLILKTPYSLVLEALGKPSSQVPFIMPKRIVDTPVSQQIADPVGSGPFVFKKDEWRAGDRTVYLRNSQYKPRAEPANGAAGGKVVKVDRLEWLPEALEQGKFSSADQFQYASRQKDDGARTAHFITFRLSFALQAFVVRDFSEIAHFVAHVPHNVFRPGFLKGWKSPFI
jgi:peptide/nickel transport system substrate-binding protein